MIKLILLLTVLTVAGTVQAYDRLTVVSTATILVDWGQTHAIVKDPNRREANPILGREPTRREVNRYFAAGVLLNYFIGDVLLKRKKGWRHMYYLQLSGIQIAQVASNHRAGVRINFKF